MILFLAGLLFGWGVLALAAYLLFRRLERIQDTAHGMRDE